MSWAEQTRFQQLPLGTYYGSTLLEGKKAIDRYEQGIYRVSVVYPLFQ